MPAVPAAALRALISSSSARLRPASSMRYADLPVRALGPRLSHSVSRRSERCLHLGRMVSVIVNDRHSPGDAFELKPPPRARKRSERTCHGFERSTDIEARQKDGEGVRDVMPSRNAQRDRGKLFPAKDRNESHTHVRLVSTANFPRVHISPGVAERIG